MNVEDLMELDYVFAKVMLYMCPHNDLVVVLQRVDLILASKFYIWYVKNHGKEYINIAKDPQVTTLILIAIHMHHARVIWYACMLIAKNDISIAGCRLMANIYKTKVGVIWVQAPQG